MTSEFPGPLPKGRGVCTVSFHPERSQSSALRDPELGSATGQSRAGGAQDHATTGSARFQEGVPSRQKKGMRENKTEGEMLIFPPDEGGKRSSLPANERESAISGSFENHFWVFPAEGARV